MKSSIKTIPAIPRLSHNRRRLRGFAVTGVGLGILLCITAQLSAGVLVSPTVVFLSNKGRTGRMTVQNPTDKPKEVSIHFSFGLPVSDSLGNVSVQLQDSAVTDPHSALGWIKAFPRRLIIPPNGTQIVRFRATPPKDLPEGEYWARVVVRSQEGETALPPPTDDGTITTKLNMIMQTAIMLKYRNGDLTPQLELSWADVRQEEDKAIVLVDLKNTSNCSYVGVLKCRLLDASDREISQNTVQLAVYSDLRRRLVLPYRDGHFEKPYHAELTITTSGRNDIPAENLLPGNTITRTFALR